MEKRGQGLSTTAIILIVLGVLVLVILIMGFIRGWDTVAPWLSSENVDKISQACSVACSGGNTYNFCSADKELTDKDKNKIITTCAMFAAVSAFDEYKVAGCPSITCVKKPCAELKINTNGDVKLGEIVTAVAGTPCSDLIIASASTDVQKAECEKETDCVWVLSNANNPINTCTGTYDKLDIAGKYKISQFASDLVDPNKPNEKKVCAIVVT